MTLSVGLGVESLNVFGVRPDSLWMSSSATASLRGIVVVIALTTLLELTSPRSRKLETRLRTSSLVGIDGFLQEFAADIRIERSVGQLAARVRARSRW